MDLTDLGAFSQREREAETFEAAVRVEDHIGGRIVRVGVLQRGHERGGKGLILVTVCECEHARAWRTSCTNFLPSRLSRAAPGTSETSHLSLSN